MTRQRLIAWCCAALLTMTPLVSARAMSIIDFGLVAPTSGTITYLGGAAPLVGTGIQVDTILGLETSLNNLTTRNLLGGVLNFTTGPFAGFSGANLTFGGGGFITLVGGVDLDNDGVLGTGDIPYGSALVTGVPTGAQWSKLSSSFSIAELSFASTVNPDLLAFYGMSNSVFVGSLNLMTLGSHPLSGDLAMIPMGEPAIAFLFAFAVAILLCVHLDRKAYKA